MQFAKPRHNNGPSLLLRGCQLCIALCSMSGFSKPPDAQAYIHVTGSETHTSPSSLRIHIQLILLSILGQA